jgi:hypothetical protein
MKADLIIITEYTKYSDIEPQFIDLLEEYGLIETIQEDNQRCIHHDHLLQIERFARMYYELSINIEGIDVINHLQQQIEILRRERRNLRNRLCLLED